MAKLDFLTYFHLINNVQVNLTSYNELELVAGLKAKNEKAFSYLYDNYAATLKGVIFAMVKDQNIAEDVLQDAFVKIWNNIEAYDDTKGRLYTWMRRLVSNLTLDVLKGKQFKMQQAIVEDEMAAENINAVNNINDYINTKHLQQKLAGLGEKKNRVIKLSYFEGYTQEEIAQQLEIPVGTVKTQIRSAIMELRKILK